MLGITLFDLTMGRVMDGGATLKRNLEKKGEGNRGMLCALFPFFP